jgi:Protein of unknown function (DUF1217)
MSGIVTGVDYSMLFAPAGSTSDVESAMLSAIFSNGNAAPSTAVSTGNPLTDLKLAQQNQTADVAKEAQVPQVARAITAFQTALGNAKTIQQALANPAIMQVLLTANNLSTYISEPAVAQKALLSDPSDPNSLVNQLGNPTLLSTAKSFAFASKGLASLQNPATIASLSNAYAEVMWRQSLDQTTPGLSNALTFLSQASSIQNVDDILGDGTNRAVVLTALNIPEQIAFQDLGAQERAVSTRVNVADFQNPTFVQKMTDQYLLAMQNQAQSSGNGTDLTSLAIRSAGLTV